MLKTYKFIIKLLHQIIILCAIIYTGADVAGGHQKLNASLALQLCRRWLIEKDHWANFSGASTSTRPSQGVSKFGDGLPTPLKDGILYNYSNNTVTVCVQVLRNVGGRGVTK